VGGSCGRQLREVGGDADLSYSPASLSLNTGFKLRSTACFMFRCSMGIRSFPTTKFCFVGLPEPRPNSGYLWIEGSDARRGGSVRAGGGKGREPDGGSQPCNVVSFLRRPSAVSGSRSVFEPFSAFSAGCWSPWDVLTLNGLRSYLPPWVILVHR
jgi:hypothetical protein